MSFVSETILPGFKAGAALTIALTQLPKLFGVPGGGEHFFERLWILGQQLPELNWVVLGFGLSALSLLLVGEKRLRSGFTSGVVGARCCEFRGRFRSGISSGRGTLAIRGQ